MVEEQGDKEIAGKKQRDLMLRRVTKGFYFARVSLRHSGTVAAKV